MSKTWWASIDLKQVAAAESEEPKQAPAVQSEELKQALEAQSEKLEQTAAATETLPAEEVTEDRSVFTTGGRRFSNMEGFCKELERVFTLG